MKSHVALVLLLPVLAACERGLDPDAALASADPGSRERAPPAVGAPVEAAPEEIPSTVGESFVDGVDHRWLPLRPGGVWTYEGEADGLHRRDEVRVLEPSRVIAGVACTALRQEVFLDGELSEVTTEWYAQDGEGNVWKFGEEAAERDGEVFVTTGDSWLAGEDGAWPWMILAADPQVGDRYVGYRPDGQEVVQILSLTGAAFVPAGTFAQCLEVEENPDDVEDADVILFAPDVGLVSESSRNGRIELVSFR